jgi:hypothetical protein
LEKCNWGGSRAKIIPTPIYFGVKYFFDNIFVFYFDK